MIKECTRPSLKEVKSGEVVHTHNPDTQGGEAGGLHIQGQPGLHIKTFFQNTKGCRCSSVIETYLAWERPPNPSPALLVYVYSLLGTYLWYPTPLVATEDLYIEDHTCSSFLPVRWDDKILRRKQLEEERISLAYNA